MNQDNLDNNQSQSQQQTQSKKTIRQQTQEEMQRELAGHQLTQEELQKTQVLNLKDVEEAVRMERFTSKKPAIVIAVLGVLLLAFGATFQVGYGLFTKSKTDGAVVQKRTVEKADKSAVVDDFLICTQAIPNNPDGTSTTYTAKYQFTNNKLSGFTKTFDITAIPGNALGPQTVANYVTAYKNFMNQTPGYNIVVSPKEAGLITTVQVDYATFNPTMLNPTQQTHFSTSVDFEKDTLKDAVVNAVKAAGMTCQNNN